VQERVSAFIVGAQKAGTTSLYDWIGQHPDVYAPQEFKDYHFFSNEALYCKGSAYFERLYKGSSKLKIHGAVNYLYFAERSAERILQYNSDAKIIICLREPSSRAISAYSYFVRTMREHRSFSEALRRELAGEISNYKERANNTYIGHGYYSRQIDCYLEYFKPEQIHIMFFEDLSHEKRQIDTMRFLCRFLGISDQFTFDYIHLNSSAAPKSRLLNFILRKSGLTKIAKVVFPVGTRKRIAKLVDQSNISDRKLDVVITSGDLKIMNDCFRNEVEELSKFTKFDFVNRWKRARRDPK